MTLNRRRAVTVIASGLALAGCATASGPGEPRVLINLADTDDTALLGSAADVARRVTVPVRINSQGPFDFVVDSGANRTVVSSELADILSLPPAGQAQIHGIAGVEPSETALINLLEVGRVPTRRLRALPWRRPVAKSR